MKKLLFIFLQIFCINGIAQSTFEKNYHFINNINDQEFSTSIIEDYSGGYFITAINGNAFKDYGIIAHLNYYGDTIWVKRKALWKTGNHDATISNILFSKDGNLLVNGIIGDTSTATDGFYWLMKLDTSGNEIWYKEYSQIISVYPPFCDNIIELPNKNIVMGRSGFLFIVADSLGNFISKKQVWDYYAPSSLSYSLNLLLEDTTLLVYCSWKVVPVWPNRTRLAKLRTNGDSISSVAIQNDSTYFGYINNSKQKGYYYIIGRSNTSSSIASTILTKIDSSGAIVWRKKYFNGNGGGFSFTQQIRETPDSGLIICGISTNNSAYLFKVNSVGDSLWYREFSPNNNTKFNNVITTSDGGFAAVGSYTPPVGYGITYIVKTDGNGLLLNTAAELAKQNKSYLHLYPNPAKEYSGLHFIGDANSILTISTLQGQEIFSELLTSNDAHVTINTSAFNAGVYICSISNNGRILANKKLVVIK
jgi:Secretion system C-terminal sorting domain